MSEVESRSTSRQSGAFSHAITVIRAHGYEPLCPEKSWRPIVSVVVDRHQCYEVKLGCDGQNPNLKERFILRDANDRSKVNINIYHRSLGEKRQKKRCLVAMTSLSLQALSKLKDTEQSFKIPLSSVARPPTRRRKMVSVYLIAKLEGPETQVRPIHDPSTSGDLLDENNMSPGRSLLAFESGSDGTIIPPCSSPAVTTSVLPDSLNIRRGYPPDNDSDQPLDDVKFINESCESSTFIGDVADLEGNHLPIAPAFLSGSTEQISVDNSMSFIDALVDSFSHYRELRGACSDSDYERILEKLKSEWCFVGASLVALCGLDAAVFGFSSSSLFSVDSFARRSIALGSVASGIGLAVDSWFLLVYGGASAKKFQKHARDIYGGYLFFSVSSRLPAASMFISACALMTFLIAVAWSAWPNVVLVMCFVAGVLLGLQFIVYGLHFVVTGTIRAVHRGWMWYSNNVSEHT